MTLNVEVGLGLSTAESLCSVAAADAYHFARGHTAWDVLSTEEKEQALRRSTDYLEAVYREQWSGARVRTTQSLSWPRFAVPMRDISAGYLPFTTYYPSAYYPNDSVPPVVVNVCASLALRSLSADLIPDVSQAVKSKRVGPLEIVYADYSQTTKRYREIDLQLLPFLNGSGGMNIRILRS